MSNPVRRACGMLIAAAIAAATTTTATAKADGGVKLRFAWPEQLSAQVQSQKTRSKQLDDQPATSSVMSSRYVMRAKRQGDAILVSFTDVQLDPQRIAALPAEQRSFMNVVAKAALPGYVVSREGDFVALSDVKSFREALRAAWEQTLPPGPERERMRPMLESMSSEAVLTGFAAGDWNWTVGSWAGAEQAFDLGDEYEFTTQVQMPLVNAPLTQHTRFKLTRKLPCERQGKTFTCVELVATTTPDEAELKEAMTRFVSKLAPDAAAKVSQQLTALDMQTQLELVTEADTLVPHRYKLRKTTRASGSEAGASHTTRQVEETEQTFIYPRAR